MNQKDKSDLRPRRSVFGDRLRITWLLLVAMITGLWGVNPLKVIAQIPSNIEEPPETEELESEPESIPSNLEELPETEELDPEPIPPSVRPWQRVSLIYNFTKHRAPINSLVFSNDSALLISGGGYNDPYMRFWSLAEGEELKEIRAQRTTILNMAISPNSETLVSSGEDGGINLWSWETGEYQTTFLDHQASVTSLAIAPDSQVLVSGGLDGIRVWNLGLFPQRPVYKLAGVGEPTSTMTLHPNGYILASGNNQGKVTFWDLRQGTSVSEFFSHREAIGGLLFTPDGNTLIAASSDRTIKLWDLATGQLLNTLTGHLGPIRTIALHPDGNILASGGNDGIILWDLQTGELLTRLNEHDNWVQSLAFSPDGRYLASGGFDFTVKVWENSEQ